MSELLDAALRYLPRTIPIMAGDKRPSVGEGWPDWPATRASVTAHYAEHPDDGVGIRTGNGLVGLDVDVWDGGDLALTRLERQHDKLPATPTVVTGSGGRHHYFRGPRAVRSRNLRAIGIDGIEIKAAGCQLVAPPSVHPDCGKFYVWHPAHPLIEREIAPLPNWIVQLAGLERNSSTTAPADLAGRDPLHRIPAECYVETLTGRTINRRGFVQCPFHGGGREFVPSLKVYPGGGWKCYGCGVGGRIYQLAGLLGGWELPLTVSARRAIRAELIGIFAEELAA
jgi:hypothetical protein